MFISVLEKALSYAQGACWVIHVWLVGSQTQREIRELYDSGLSPSLTNINMVKTQQDEVMDSMGVKPGPGRRSEPLDRES